MAIGSAVAGVASMLIGYGEGEKDADLERMQQEMNNTIAMQDAVDQYSQLNAAERDINESTMQQVMGNQLSMLEQKEKAKLLAGASGTQGASVNSILFDMKQTGGRNQATIIDNRSKGLDDIAAQAQGIRYGARRGMDTRALSRPSIGQAASQGYSTYKGASSLVDAWNEYK